MEFNEKLLNLRKEKGLSQEELGEKLGVTRQTVSKWELGATSPKLDDLKKISELFNVSLDELSGITKEKEIKEDGKKDKKHSKSKIIIVLILVVIFVVFIGIIIYRYFALKTFYERYEQIRSDVDMQYDLNYSEYYSYDNEVTNLFDVVSENEKVSVYDFLNSTIKIENYYYDDKGNLTVVHETYEYGDDKQYVNETDNKSNMYEYLLWKLRLGEEIGINLFSEKSIISLTMDFNYKIDMNDNEIVIKKEENDNDYLISISRKEDAIYFYKSVCEDDNNKANKIRINYSLTSIDKNKSEHEVLLERVKKQVEEYNDMIKIDE